MGLEPQSPELGSEEADRANLEVIVLSWLGGGQVLDADNRQLLGVLGPKGKQGPVPVSILDLCGEGGQRKVMNQGSILLERNVFHEESLETPLGDKGLGWG